MKVILLQDVAKIGRRFEVVDVPNGYALNKLVPQGLAEPATPGNVKRLEAQKANAESMRTDSAERFAQALELIGDNKIVVSAAANAQGHFFEALKPASIVGAIAGSGAVVTEDQIHIESPIKEAGEYTIKLSEGDQQKEIIITVQAESEEDSAA